MEQLTPYSETVNTFLKQPPSDLGIAYRSLQTWIKKQGPLFDVFLVRLRVGEPNTHGVNMYGRVVQLPPYVARYEEAHTFPSCGVSRIIINGNGVIIFPPFSNMSQKEDQAFSFPLFPGNTIRIMPQYWPPSSTYHTCSASNRLVYLDVSKMPFVSL